MRRIATLLTVGVLAVTGTACGDDDGSVDTGTTTSADPDESVESPPLDGTLPGEEPGAELVEPRAGMAGVTPHGFESADPVDDGRVLAVRYWSGVAPCSVLDSVEVDESATEVVVTLMVGHEPDAGDVACIQIAQLYETRVELRAPLGEREVVDGAR